MTKQFFSCDLFIKQWVSRQKRLTNPTHVYKIVYDLKRKTIFSEYHHLPFFIVINCNLKNHLELKLKSVDFKLMSDCRL